MFDLPAYLDRCRQAANHAIEEICSVNTDDSRLNGAMAYSLKAGGKRVRPALCMAAAEAVGTADHEVVTAAVAIEMVHTYSLIHDDLPAMDDDDLRRGEAAMDVGQYEGTAHLAGGALLTPGLQVLADTAPGLHQPARNWRRVVRGLSAPAGRRGVQ